MDLQPDPEIPVDEDPSTGKTAEVIAYIPALISAVLCVGLIRSGFPAFFFLVPLGFMAYGYNLLSAWATVLGAVLMNSMFSLGFSSGSGKHPWVDIVYFALMMVVFAGIVAPPFKGLRISLAYRFIAGSVIGALFLWFMIGTAKESFDAFFQSQGEMLSSFYIASAGTDVVQRSLLEQYVTPETIIKVIGFVMLRGGGIASCLVIFFISRQISLVFTRLIRRINIRENIGGFHAAPELIWVLSFSLLGILLSKLVAISPLEILAWNMVTICGILYLGQGGGIVWHFLTQRNLPPLMRVFFNILIIILIFSPGINAVILGLLILLGIAENWVPFRSLKSDRPSSTPRM